MSYETDGKMTGADLIHYMYEDMYWALGAFDTLAQIIEMKKKGGDWIHQFEEQFENEVFESICAELRGDISRYEHNISEFERRLNDMEIEE